VKDGDVEWYKTILTGGPDLREWQIAACQIPYNWNYIYPPAAKTLHKTRPGIYLGCWSIHSIIYGKSPRCPSSTSISTTLCSS